jgi:hypothetical protein
MDILDYVLLPHFHVLHMVFTFFPFVITNDISYLSSSMLTFIALEDYITRRLILTTIILLYYSSTTTLRASSFGPDSFWHIFSLSVSAFNAATPYNSIIDSFFGS